VGTRRLVIATGTGTVRAACLVDTHALLWFAIDDARLTATARDALMHTSLVYVSAASAWELHTKAQLGKLTRAAGLVSSLGDVVDGLGFTALAIEFADAELAGALASAHRDPFDRMLAAQAIRRSIPIISADTALDSFGAHRLW
jgi:PIN domain nuclease of toxin-antitoxin system